MNAKLLSVIVPVYHTEKYLRRALESILASSYQNIEVIVVDDGSHQGADEICKGFDARVRYVDGKKNRGLYHARLLGAKEAKGDYLAFLDSDDHVSVDFYRHAIAQAETTNSDLVLGEFVLEYPDGHYEINDLMHVYNCDLDLKGESIRHLLFDQYGIDYSLHVIWNKVIARSLWKRIEPMLVRQRRSVTMCEDVIFSSFLYCYAEHLTNFHHDFVYYVQRPSSSTGKGKTVADLEKIVSEIRTVFSFLHRSFQDNHDIEVSITKWENLLYGIWECNIKQENLPEEDASRLRKSLRRKKIDGKEPEILATTPYWEQLTKIPEPLGEKLKREILSHEIRYVSFDLFDTLVVRPFLRPTDLFKLMGARVSELLTTSEDIAFVDQRRLAETIARREVREKGKPEVTLAEIYRVLQRLLHLTRAQAKEIEKLEVAFEKRYCYPRAYAKELYDFALSAGKKVIVVSDMYLPRKVLEEILLKAGFEDVAKIFVSSEQHATKWDGTLYEKVTAVLKAKPSEILHIGDNFSSDVQNAKKAGWKSSYLPNCKDLLQNKVAGMDTGEAYQRVFQEAFAFRRRGCIDGYLGMRCMLGVVANRIFDNPWAFRRPDSDFAGSPSTLGYYAVGMYLFGICDWLCHEMQKHGYDSIHFMARDGYLPMKGYEILSKAYGIPTKVFYDHFSRASILPLELRKETDIFSLFKLMNFHAQSPMSFLSRMKGFIAPRLYARAKEIVEKEGFKWETCFDDLETFDRFLTLYATKFYDAKRFAEYRDTLGQALKDRYYGKVATFDIGYSCRVESALTYNYGFDITPYYIHMNNDQALFRGQKNHLDVHTFYGYSPGVTGILRELLISELAPSCTGLSIEKGRIVPQYREYHENPYRDHIVGTIQENAVDFVRDMCEIFGEDFPYLYYQRADAGLVQEYLEFYAKREDYEMFRGIRFEDDFGRGKTFELVDFWKRQMDEVLPRMTGKEQNAMMMSEQMLERLKNPNYSFALGEDIYARFRFPWEVVPSGSRVVIYGGGVVGKMFLRQVARSSYCFLKAICDRNPVGTGIQELPAITLAELAGMPSDSYDMVLIAIEKKNIAQAIRNDLLLEGIPSEKIKWVDPARKK